MAPADLDAYLLEKWQNADSHFFLDPDLSGYREAIADPHRVVEVANAALEGRFLFFSRWWADLGDPPDWLMNPVDGIRYPGDTHWSLVPDLSAELGDIKYVWEASRFSHVYYLARAYALTGDERYADGFWNHLESWVQANPPEYGPNWRCGQEIAIRSFAWIFGLYAFGGLRVTTPERVALLLKYLWYNAWHIERNHWYALRCVRNNHSLSEAAGMFTIGTLFPFFKESTRWRKKGFSHLVREALWQICTDGSYSMHSTNYSRFVVQLFSWSLRIAQVNETEFPNVLIARLRKLLHFLRSMQDEKTGQLPNYGSNDGALIFPLSSCDYLDYRPSLNALSVILDGESLYGPGPWLEETTWFRGPAEQRKRNGEGVVCVSSTSENSSTVQIARRGASFPVGGYYVLRGQNAFAMIRCGEYRHRPYQADMLHLDLWYNGQNLLVDAGTYSYNPRGGWLEYFAGTSSHNTVTVDDRDQMRKGGRFLWSNWARGRALQFSTIGLTQLFIGEHAGYSPVIHRRFSAQKDDAFLVVDDLFGDDSEHEFTLHWLVGDVELELNPTGAVATIEDTKLLLRVGCTQEVAGTWAKGQANPMRGWWSLYYGERLPAWSYRVTARVKGPVRFFTLIQPLSKDRETTTLLAAEVDDIMRTWGLGRLWPIGEYPSCGPGPASA
ncbi:MAG: heparinase II/III family protein [Firmicutes bacterium]|nr:heparinase II/III family protein [Bacillota bacterium]MDH7496243.1 alginate lyase family protein [Bacillota bacterium]